MPPESRSRSVGRPTAPVPCLILLAMTLPQQISGLREFGGGDSNRVVDIGTSQEHMAKGSQFQGVKTCIPQDADQQISLDRCSGGANRGEFRSFYGKTRQETGVQQHPPPNTVEAGWFLTRVGELNAVASRFTSPDQIKNEACQPVSTPVSLDRDRVARLNPWDGCRGKPAGWIPDLGPRASGKDSCKTA